MTSASATHGDSRPVVGHGLPAFTLGDTGGVLRHLWDYKQRHPVLLTVLRDTHNSLSREWLGRLLAEQRDLDEHCAAVLVVALEPLERLCELQASLDLPLTLLADPDGAVARQYLSGGTAGERLTIYLADRYLQCLGRWHVREQGDLPWIDDIAAKLALADQDDCACGLPAWPED